MNASQIGVIASLCMHAHTHTHNYTEFRWFLSNGCSLLSKGKLVIAENSFFKAKRVCLLLFKGESLEALMHPLTGADQKSHFLMAKRKQSFNLSLRTKVSLQRHIINVTGRHGKQHLHVTKTQLRTRYGENTGWLKTQDGRLPVSHRFP